MVGVVGGECGNDWENYRFEGMDSKIGDELRRC